MDGRASRSLTRSRSGTRPRLTPTPGAELLRCAVTLLQKDGDVMQQCGEPQRRLAHGGKSDGRGTPVQPRWPCHRYPQPRHSPVGTNGAILVSGPQ